MPCELDPWIWILEKRRQKMLHTCIKRSMKKRWYTPLVSYDEMYAECTYDTKRIFDRFDITKGALVPWVYVNWVWEIRRLCKLALETDAVHRSIDADEALSDELIISQLPVGSLPLCRAEKAMKELLEKLAPEQLSLLIAHDVTGETFEQMASYSKRSRASTQRDHMKALFAARKIVKDAEI